MLGLWTGDIFGQMGCPSTAQHWHGVHDEAWHSMHGGTIMPYLIVPPYAINSA